MDATALPPRPRVAQYRKQAKDLLHVSRAGDPEAVHRVSRYVRPRDRPHQPRSAQQAEYRLADAQFVIAREHGFESWATFASHVERLEYRDAPVARFEAAADAVVSGDVATLTQLLRDDPTLVRARSTRAHHPTLPTSTTPDPSGCLRSAHPPSGRLSRARSDVPRRARAGA